MRCYSSNSFRRCDTTRIFHIIDTSFTDRASLYFFFLSFPLLSCGEKYFLFNFFHLSTGVYLSPTSCVVVEELKHQYTIWLFSRRHESFSVLYIRGNRVCLCVVRAKSSNERVRIVIYTDTNTHALTKLSYSK